MSKATIANNAEALFNYAVDALSAASNWVSDIEENGIPLKDAKDVMLKLAADAPDALKSRLQAMATVRTKKGFAELTVSLEEHSERLRRAWQDALEDAKEEAEQAEAAAAAAEAEAEQGSELDQLAHLSERIHDLLAERMANTLAIGEALSKAKELFSKGSDFLKWADSACNLKKAQVYKWIKVWESFGGEPLFNGVAMRVLYTLTGYAEDSLIFMEAVKVIDGGEVLDSKRLTAIIQEHEAPKPSPVTEPELVEDASTPANAPESDAPEAPEQAPEDETTPPWEMAQDDAEQLEQEPSEPSAPASEPTVNPPVQASELTRRDRQIEELTARVAELTKLLEEAQRPKQAAPAQLPPLPQFDQACPFAVLGLSRDAEGDAAAIKRAHRALAKLYNGQPEVSEKLMNARLALLGKSATKTLIG